MTNAPQVPAQPVATPAPAPASLHFGRQVGDEKTDKDGKKIPNGEISLKIEALRTHMCVMGTTGSGKTGVILGIAEQMINHGIPVVLVDNKGDLINILMQKDPALKAKIAWKVLTPAQDFGTPVNCFAGLNRRDKVDETLSMLLDMIGEKSDPITSKPHTFLAKVCQVLHDHNVENITLRQLIAACATPPFNDFGAMDIEEAYPKRSRTALAAKLNTVLTSPSFANWRNGDALDLDKLLAIRTDGKVNVTVYHVANLADDKARDMSLSVLLTEFVSWMKRQPGTAGLRASLIIDECAGLLPPYPKSPPTKLPIMTMLKQGRAFGLSLTIASQNPMDFDYKAMGNCQTWVVGRLQTANDRKRVIDVIASSSSHDRCLLESQVGRLADRQFMLVRPRSKAIFTSREVSSDLRGPLTGKEIRALIDKLEAEDKAAQQSQVSGPAQWSV
jgi:hypothetical protein